MVQFLGSPLEIPAAVTGTQAVRKSFVDAIGNRVTTLEAAGVGGLTTIAKSAAYTAAARDFVLADATAAAFTVTLPATPPLNTVVAVKKVDTTSHVVAVVAAGGRTIDGDTAVNLAAPQTAGQFIYDGANWRVAAVVVYDTGVIPGFTYRGTYDPATGYLVKDVVYYAGNSYVAKMATSGTAPTVDASDARWGLMALHGVKGDNGVIYSSIVAKTAAYTAAVGDYVLGNTTGGTFTVTLPAAPVTGSIVGVKRADSSANDLIVVGSGATTIDGDANCTLNAPHAGATFLFDGTNWVIQSTALYG